MFREALAPLPPRKAQAIIALLALEPSGRLSRETLRARLWSEVSQPQASLRNSLAKLFSTLQAIRFEGLTKVGGDLVFDLDLMRSDVADILAALDEGIVDERLSADPELFETLLRQFDHLDEALAEHLRTLRAALRRTVVQRLEQLLRGGSSRVSDRRALATLFLAYEPYSEWALRILIQAHLDEGDNASALAVYQTFWHGLEAAFGEEPSAETQALIVRVKSEPRDTALTPVGAAAVRAETRPRILVDLVDRSNTPQGLVGLVAGFRNDLVAALIRFREWRTIDCQDPFRRYAAEMGDATCYRLITSGRDGAHGPEFTIRFVNAHTDEGVWSERFVGNDAFWTAAQNSIVRRIAIALSIHLASNRLEAARRRPDATLDAYDAWLRAEELVEGADLEKWARARRLLTRLIEDHPTFSRGFCCLARIENTRHLYFPGIRLTEADQTRALAWARRAVDLDPLDSRSQLCLGWCCAVSGLWERAEIAFRIAYENNENDPWTLVSAAVGMAFCDRIEVALELAGRALSNEFSPSPLHWSFQAVIRFLAEDYEACVRACDLAESVSVDVPAWRGAALAQLGRRTEAEASVRRFVAEARANWKGAAPATDEAVAGWLVDCYPLKRPETWSRLFSGLRAAGLHAAAPRLGDR